jgi:hypothetical protein
VLAFSQILLLFVALCRYAAVVTFCFLESQMTPFLLQHDCMPAVECYAPVFSVVYKKMVNDMPYILIH